MNTGETIIILGTIVIVLLILKIGGYKLKSGGASSASQNKN